jgi:hypothetical protein
MNVLFDHHKSIALKAVMAVYNCNACEITKNKKIKKIKQF